MKSVLSDPATDNAADSPSWIVRSAVAPLVLLVVGFGALIGGLGFAGSASRFPVAVSILLLILAGIDLYCRTGLPGAQGMTAFWGTDFTRREMPIDPPLRAELIEIGWVFACFILMAVVGILPALPIYVAGYIRLRGLSWRTGLFAAAGLLVFVVVVFEVALGYSLYRGLLVTDGGIAAW